MRWQSDYASDILYLVAVYFSKASACGLFLRLTPNKHHVMFCWGILGASSAWLVASILAVAIKCRVSEPWVVNAQCSGVVSVNCKNPFDANGRVEVAAAGGSFYDGK